jgi:hypothetical protein
MCTVLYTIYPNNLWVKDLSNLMAVVSVPSQGLPDFSVVPED